VFQLNEHPFAAFNKFFCAFNFLVQATLVCLSISVVLSLQGYEIPSSESLPAFEASNLIPFDVLSTSVFFIFHFNLTDYVGVNELDRAQYLAVRALPFLTVFFDLCVSTKTTIPPEYKLILGFFTCI
jgi:hypothetical protein